MGERDQPPADEDGVVFRLAVSFGIIFVIAFVGAVISLLWPYLQAAPIHSGRGYVVDTEKSRQAALEEIRQESGSNASARILRGAAWGSLAGVVWLGVLKVRSLRKQQ